MVVGVLTLELFLPEAQSLKGKRSLLRPLVEHIRRNWNVSVAEIAHQDTWQRALLGVAAVSAQETRVRGVLDEVSRYAGNQGSIQVVDSSVEFY